MTPPEVECPLRVISGHEIDSSATTFASATDLASALCRTALHTANARGGQVNNDADWPDWYAAYMAAERSGDPLPS
jgi:hypothetical protein